MAGEIVNLNEHRAKEKKDCRLWTPLDALKAAVRAIEDGGADPGMVFIAFRTKPDEDGAVEFSYLCAGGTNLEMSGLLAQHMTRLCLPT